MTKRFYSIKSIPPIYRPPFCARDESGRVWKDPSTGVDFHSPDALLYSVVSYDSLAPGSDTAIASLELRFGYGEEPGVIEIDTTCVYPGNRLTFVDMAVNRIVPAFEKGIITVVEPTDTLSGHVSADLSLRGSIYLGGDLTIDSGVTVSIRRATSVLAFGNQDDQHAGMDSGRVEIIVEGSLVLDACPGVRPAFASTAGQPADWYGIRVVDGGRFESGIGAVIEDAVIGLEITRGVAPDTLANLTMRNCSSRGIVTYSDDIAFIGDTVVGAGIGIYADSASPLIQDCYIDSCGVGIRTRFSSATIEDTWIDGPGTFGIEINNMTPLFGSPTPETQPIVRMASDEPTYNVTLKRDTVSGYFATAQLSMGLSSGYCSLDSCGFVNPAGSQRSPYGLRLNMNDNVIMRRSSVTGFTNTGIYSARATVNLGLSPSSPGNNDISADSAGCGGCLLRRVSHTLGTDSLRAEGNWWGSATPPAAWFSGKVDWNPYLDSPPAGKIIIPEAEGEVATILPTGFTLSQNYPNPFNSSTEIEFGLSSAEHVAINVYNVLGQVVKKIADRDYPEGTFRVTWDGTNDDGQKVASGVYLYRIVAGEYTQTKKMVLLK